MVQACDYELNSSSSRVMQLQGMCSRCWGAGAVACLQHDPQSSMRTCTWACTDAQSHSSEPWRVQWRLWWGRSSVCVWLEGNIPNDEA